MNKIVITALFYVVMIPMSVWIGLKLNTMNFILAIPLIIFVMVLQLCIITLWFEVQSEILKEK